MHELTQRGDGLWTSDGALDRGGFPLRMALLQAEDGRTLLWSPIKLNDALADSIEQKGRPFAALAPNAFHHLYLGAAGERFKGMQLWAAPGVAKKQPSLTLRTLELAPAEPRVEELAPGILALVTPGIPKLNEVAVFHRPSRTLIVADLLFNMQSYDSWLIDFMLLAAGTRKRFGQSRLIGLLTKDPAALGAAKQTILSWDFDRVVMAHGDIVESGAKDRVAEIWKAKS